MQGCGSRPHEGSKSPSGMGAASLSRLPACLRMGSPETSPCLGPGGKVLPGGSYTVLRLSWPGQPKCLLAGRVGCQFLLAWRGPGCAHERVGESGHGGDVRVFPLPGTHTAPGTGSRSSPQSGGQLGELASSTRSLGQPRKRNEMKLSGSQGSTTVKLIALENDGDLVSSPGSSIHQLCDLNQVA